MPECMVYTVII